MFSKDIKYPQLTLCDLTMNEETYMSISEYIVESRNIEYRRVSNLFRTYNNSYSEINDMNIRTISAINMKKEMVAIKYIYDIINILELPDDIRMKVYGADYKNYRIPKAYTTEFIGNIFNEGETSDGFELSLLSENEPVVVLGLTREANNEIKEKYSNLNTVSIKINAMLNRDDSLKVNPEIIYHVIPLNRYGDYIEQTIVQIYSDLYQYRASFGSGVNIEKGFDMFILTNGLSEYRTNIVDRYLYPNNEETIIKTVEKEISNKSLYIIYETTIDEDCGMSGGILDTTDNADTAYELYKNAISEGCHDLGLPIPDSIDWQAETDSEMKIVDKKFTVILRCEYVVLE